jgi:DNA polymerase-3 subunit epsilon
MDDYELQKAREEAIAADKGFSKGRLRDEFRMKPKPDAIPIKYYKNDYGRKFGVYRIADCIPIRVTQQSEPTEKQKRARAIMALKAKLRSNEARAGEIACAWLAEDPLFLDTETTGLGYNAQIIELALADAAGRIHFETRMKPTVPVEPEAASTHGIDEVTLASAPTWPEIAHQVKKLVAGRPVVIFNAEFDSRMIHQTCSAFGESSDWWKTVETRCAMYLAAKAFGSTNRYGSISLESATSAAGVTWTGAAHSAAADTLATVELVNAIAAYRRDIERQLSELGAMPDTLTTGL